MNFDSTFANRWRLLPVCAASLMLGACAHRVTEREIVHEQPIVQQVPAPSRPDLLVVTPPPPPQESMSPAPAPSGYSWLPGHYTWQDGWHWHQGRWVAGTVPPMPEPYREDPSSAPAPSGQAQWVPGYWNYNGGEWAWTHGHWESRLGPKGDGSSGANQMSLPSAER